MSSGIYQTRIRVTKEQYTDYEKRITWSKTSRKDYILTAIIANLNVESCYSTLGYNEKLNRLRIRFKKLHKQMIAKIAVKNKCTASAAVKLTVENWNNLYLHSDSEIIKSNLYELKKIEVNIHQIKKVITNMSFFDQLPYLENSLVNLKNVKDELRRIMLNK